MAAGARRVNTVLRKPSSVLRKQKGQSPQRGKLPKSLPHAPGRLQQQGRPIIGVDEAGRGPWAGPVVAAAVAFTPKGAKAFPLGITDSKLLKEPQREWLYKQLQSTPGITWSVSVTNHKRVDKVNILEATLESMTKSVHGVSSKLRSQGRRPGEVQIDGNRVPVQLSDMKCRSVIGGDRKNFVIAAASILAKVTRDRIMTKLHKKYPKYGFKQHKGYGTASHFKLLKKHGPSLVHRRSFDPLKGFLETRR